MKKYNDYKSNKLERQQGLNCELTPDELKKVEWIKYKIIVPTEEDRQELMEAFEHIHYSDIDTDYVAVNQLVHEYLDNERIEGVKNNIIVDKELYEKLNS